MCTLTVVADYASIPALELYVLEESWVLGVLVSPGLVEFDMDLCFAASHPGLRPPRDGEYAYFRRGVIRFTGVTSVRWEDMNRQAATDAAGEHDWGHIDFFARSERTYRLEGDFGLLELEATAVEFTLTSPA